MGLDMYLSKYPKVIINGKRIPLENLDPDTLSIENPSLFQQLEPLITHPYEFMPEWRGYHQKVGYWRKANAIHRWFVENVQNGEDDCRSYAVSREQLTELHDICQRLIRELKVGSDGCIVNTWLAEKLLPTRGGFFFGSTAYDRWYMEDLRSTCDQISKVLAELNDDTHYICYDSSW